MVKKITCLVMAILSVCLMSGCSVLLNELLGPKEYPEEGLIVYTHRDVCKFEYSKKVAVILFTQPYDDTLRIRPNDKYDENWMNTEKKLLEGYFDKVAYHEGKIFILCNEKYYMFNVDTYVYSDEYYYPEYEFKEYTKEEFEKQYPQQEYFDWYGH